MKFTFHKCFALGALIAVAVISGRGSVMRFSKILACLAAAVFLSFGTVSAKAEIYTFSVNLNGGPDFNFNLNSSPTPDYVNLGGSFGMFDVMTSIGTVSEIYFYAPAIDNGFSALIDGIPLLDSSTLLPFYSGSENAPTFLPGTYTLLNFFGTAEIGSLTIASAVPELSTWAMMILGFAVMAWFGSRRLNKAVAA